jgi:peptide/nickel transport system substrate-binding protein
MSRRRFLETMASFGLVLAGPGLLYACGSNESEGGGAQELRVLGGENFPPAWNPYGHIQLSGYILQAGLYDRLVEVTPSLELEPGLAESWEQLDERTWEFKLRDGVSFHEGQPFTARDVKASIELVSGFTKVEEPLSASSWWTPHEVEVVDDRTARLRGAEGPFAPLLYTLTGTDILPAEGIERGLKFLEEGPPNGTGPFRLNEESSNEKRFTAYQEYFRGPAKIDRLVMEYVADPQTRVNALLSDQASITGKVTPDQTAAIERRDDVRVMSVPSIEILKLDLRMDKEPFGGNPALRRALAWGIDRQALVGVIGGATRLATSHIAEGILYQQPQDPPYEFDPERAKAELEAAGVNTPVSFEFYVSTGGYPKSREVGELITENLNSVGFDVTLQVMETAAWLDVLLGEEKRGAMFHAGTASLWPDPDFALAFAYYSPVEGITGYKNERVDDLIERGRTTTEEGERRRIYEELQALLWEDLPAIPLYYSGNADGVRSEVKGYEPYPTYIPHLYPVSVDSGA